ncbi:MAG: citramalate synthase [Smithellaceae bacterium]|nr:citramalate synthase [Smithellaceae bacterium]
MTKPNIQIYDTTLRDGAQGEQINFSVEEKVRIAHRLDEMGFSYIEGGWPGSNPKDKRFFELAKTMNFKHARLTAFGCTTRPGTPPEDDPNIQSLLEAGTPTVTVFGKSWDLHVSEILRIPLEENLEMIHRTLKYLKQSGKEVIFDAEHFFYGYKANGTYVRQVIEAALAADADMIVLCDTNGGTLPQEITKILGEVSTLIPGERLGIHAHNDSGLGVANSLAAVLGGAVMVQGTINGLGERCGNADLITLIANLQLKMGRICLPDSSIGQLTSLSHFVSDVANIPPLNTRPFVGRSAFTHKGGMHVNGIVKNAAAYEHIKPESVGNLQRVVVSDMAGKSAISYKARELGMETAISDDQLRNIVAKIKEMEDEGYQFDSAEGSLSLLLKKMTGQFQEPFTLESFQVITAKVQEEHSLSQAMIKISVGQEEELAAAEGNGPVNALDHALRKALVKFYPRISEMHLVDFKVRTLEGSEGTAAKVRVLLDSRDTEDFWSTVGVSTNVIEASWLALVDSIQYKLSKDRDDPEA